MKIKVTIHTENTVVGKERKAIFKTVEEAIDIINGKELSTIEVLLGDTVITVKEV